MGRTLRRIIFLIFLIISCQKKVEEIKELPKVEEEKEEIKMRTYVIYFLKEESIELELSTITLQEKENEIENIKILLKNYFSLKEQNIFPLGLETRAVFPIDSTLVIDLKFPEGEKPYQSVKEEQIFLKALAKTLCLNFQRYKSVFVLINGKTENNFINHLALHVSYKP